MREEDRRLFPLVTVGSVVQLFRQQLTGSEEPDLALLSVVAGCVENCMTTTRVAPTQSLQTELLVENEPREPEVADVENLKLEPKVELHIVDALCAKFESIIKGYCDLSLFRDGKYASRGLVKRVSDIVWNTLSKSHYKDRAHLQSIYSYLTGNKLDCFGVAFAVVAGCQVLGFSDVHLALSEDHAWVVFGEEAETAEVTWHGKGNEDKRGQSVEETKARASWLYVGGRPVVCSRHEEVAALVSSINPAISSNMDSLEVGVLQQELLWLCYDLGHLEKYPMALGNLGDLEEISSTPGRPTSKDIFEEAVSVNQRIYGSFHVYPYTYSAGYRYRQGDFKGALKAWAEAAGVVKRYKYSKDDEEIYKEFMEINNELIPHILKTEETVLQDANCYSHLLQFYDGLCSWEEDSATPVLHTGWVKPIVKSFMSFDHNVRSQVCLTLASLEEEAEEVRRGNEVFSFGDHQQVTCVPETVNNNYNTERTNDRNNSIAAMNNNYKSSLDDCDIECDTELDMYLCKDNCFPHEKFTNDFERMKVNQLLKLASETFETEMDKSANGKSKSKFVDYLIEKSGEKLFNIDCLLGQAECQPFMNVEKYQNLETLCSFEKACYDSDLTNHTILENPSKKGDRKPAVNNLKLYSVKMGALKDLIQAEKMNASALHLQLTAQTQTEVKKHRTSQESEGRSKRARRE